MTKPNSNPPPQGFFDTIGAFINAFGKLQALLAFAGLFGALILFFGWLTGNFPDWTLLLAIFIVGVLAYLVFTFGNRYFDVLEQRNAGTKPDEDGETPPPAKPSERPPAPSLPDGKLETLYLQEIVYRCGWISTTTFDPKARHAQAEKLHLSSVFTELDVPREPRDERPAAELEMRAVAAREAAEIEKESRQPVLASLSRHPRLVLRGKPGSGKSTLVNYLALCLAGDRLGETDFNVARLAKMGWDLPAQLPVRVILRDYAARGLPEEQSLWQFVVAELARVSDGQEGTLAAYAPVLEETLTEKGGLLLLDGYDEVPEARKQRQKLKEAIIAFRRRFDKVRILVTSRPYAYENPAWQLPDFTRTELLDFSPDQVSEYIKSWYEAMAGADPNLTQEQATAFTKQLQTETKENPNLRELAPRPLLLALMCSLHRSRGGGTLPQERHQLYEESVELLLDLWERPKRIYDAQGQVSEERSALIELGIPKNELRAVLNQVAYEVHKEQAETTGTADIPERKLAGLLVTTPSLQNKKGVSREDMYGRIVTYLKNRAGLLEDRGPDPDGHHVYAFPHRTFQEYLAACHLSGATFPTEIATLARQRQNRWREVLLLAAGRANTDYSVWGLVGKLCLTPPPAERAAAPDEAWWGAFLAGQVLLEKELTGPVADREDQARRERVQGWHKAILGHGTLPPRDRALAGEALAALGDDRPGVRRCDEMGLCLVPPGDFWLANWDEEGGGDWYTGLNRPYWLAQYPVTVAQFREFVEESGFEPSYARGSLDGPHNWPVAWINWYDALAFCEWLDTRWRQKGWLPDGYAVTLPNETEWEKAARGGRQIPAQPQVVTPEQLAVAVQNVPTLKDNPLPKRRFPWGDAPEQEETPAGDTRHRANNESAGIGGRCAVGSFPPGRGPHGCLDLSGQVWEWTRSLHGKPYPPRPTPEFETADRQNRGPIILRGGAYYRDQNLCSVRYGATPGNYFIGNLGVRVVVSPFLTSGR